MDQQNQLNQPADNSKKSLLIGTVVVLSVVILGVVFQAYRSFLGARALPIPERNETIVGGRLVPEALSEGQHTLEYRARTSDGHVIGDQVTFNVQPNFPDLIIDNVQIKGGQVKVQENATLVVRVKNQGTANTTFREFDNFKVRLRFDQNSDGSYEQTYWGISYPLNQSVSALEAGATETLEFIVRNLNDEGAHTVEVCADTMDEPSELHNLVEESNEENNCKTAVLAIGEQSDLAVKDVTVEPASPQVNGQIAVRTTITNQGGGASNPTQVLLCRQGALTQDRRCEEGWPEREDARVDIPSIEPGQSQDVALTWTPNSAGTYVQQVCIHGGSNPNDKRDNNCSNNIRTTVSE